MRHHATRILSAVLGLTAAASAPLAAHGDHPGATGGVLHLLLHLLANPWAWAVGAAAVVLAVLSARGSVSLRGTPEVDQR